MFGADAAQLGRIIAEEQLHYGFIRCRPIGRKRKRLNDSLALGTSRVGDVRVQQLRQLCFVKDGVAGQQVKGAAHPRRQPALEQDRLGLGIPQKRPGAVSAEAVQRGKAVFPGAGVGNGRQGCREDVALLVVAIDPCRGMVNLLPRCCGETGLRTLGRLCVEVRLLDEDLAQMPTGDADPRRAEHLKDLRLAHLPHIGQEPRQALELRAKLPIVAIRQRAKLGLPGARGVPLLFEKADVVGVQFQILHDHHHDTLILRIWWQEGRIDRAAHFAVNRDLAVLGLAHPTARHPPFRFRRNIGSSGAAVRSCGPTLFTLQPVVLIAQEQDLGLQPIHLGTQGLDVVQQPLDHLPRLRDGDRVKLKVIAHGTPSWHHGALVRSIPDGRAERHRPRLLRGLRQSHVYSLPEIRDLVRPLTADRCRKSSAVGG